MKILCTGGAGYLGSVLVPKLLAYGHRVVVMDNFSHGVPSLVGCGGHRDLDIVRGDIEAEPTLFKRLIVDSDAVIHLAAIVGAPACGAKPRTATLVNLRATEDLLEWIRPDQPLIFPCTNSGYGKGGERLITEDDPMTPLSLYGTLKVASEKLVLEHPLGVSLRFATLYGPSPRMRLDLLVNAFAHTAVSSEDAMPLYEPHFRRCVLHVSDAAEALGLAVENADTLGRRPWNVGAENVTKLELCQMIKAAVPRFRWAESAGRDPDQRDYSVSSDRFKAESGWAPLVRLEEGIAQLVRLYRMPFDGPAWRNA